MEKRTAMLFRIVLILAILAGGTAIAVGPARKHQARKKAAAFAAERGIETDYRTNKEVRSREAFLKEIWSIASWEKETRDALNSAFEHTDKEYGKRKEWDVTISGYAEEEELTAFAMRERWLLERDALNTEIRNEIRTLFGDEEEMYGIKREAAEECFDRNYSEKILEVMTSVEDGSGMEAFSKAAAGLGREWSSLPMDIAFGLRPKLLTAGCEAQLLSALKSGEYYKISGSVSQAEEFAGRYGVSPEGLDKAKSREAALEYQMKPEVPAVGMSLSQARSTKLGAPARTTTEKASWSHKQHTYGEMYWEKSGVQIYKAHYRDGEITDVWDSRSLLGKTTKRPSYSSSSSGRKTTFDPDDHDIESYYQDHQDEYDDYDDAYDGFLDDDGAWDDY